MTSGGPLQIVESMWDILPPLAVRGLIQGDATTPYIYLVFLWEGHLHGPLRVHPLVKVRRVRRMLATLLEADLSGYPLNTISGPMSPGRPLGNFAWEASETLSLVKTLQPVDTHLPVPNPGQGPPALDRGQLFVRHALTDTGICTISTVTPTSRLTARELIDRLRPGAVHRWYLLYGGKILKPDVLIPAHLRNKTLDLAGNVNGGSASGGVALDGDDSEEPDLGRDIVMDDDSDNDDTLPGDNSPAHDVSDLDRTRARGWCQDLLNLGQLHTRAECIGLFTKLFNLTEAQALAVISEHLYGSSL